MRTPQSQECKVTIECPPLKAGEPQVCKATFDCPPPEKGEGEKGKEAKGLSRGKTVGTAPLAPGMGALTSFFYPIFKELPHILGNTGSVRDHITVVLEPLAHP